MIRHGFKKRRIDRKSERIDPFGVLLVFWRPVILLESEFNVDSNEGIK